MPNVSSRVKALERRFLAFAPKRQQEKIKKVVDIYKELQNIPFLAVQNMALVLYSPTTLGPRCSGKASKCTRTS